MRNAQVLTDKLADARGGRVVFLSHCLLNQNVRYLGGAFRPGAVEQVVEGYLRDGVGIYQMPCPEQRAWGGALKRYTLSFYGAGTGVRLRLLKALLPLLLLYTRRVYRSIARQVVRDIEDYVRSGFEVVGVVGIAGSPSCGVCRTLDLSRSLEVVAACPLARLDRRVIDEAVAGAITEGEGIFTEELRRRLRRRGVEVAFQEHDSLAATAT